VFSSIWYAAEPRNIFDRVLVLKDKNLPAGLFEEVRLDSAARAGVDGFEGSERRCGTFWNEVCVSVEMERSVVFGRSMEHKVLAMLYTICVLDCSVLALV
jgi:hypothetical protein